MCERLEEIKKRVSRACERSGRDPAVVTIVAVSKKKPAEMIRKLYNCGHRVFGENYVQEGIEKIGALSDLNDITWHFIGHLQRNKAKLAVLHFHWVQTVDSVRLARALNRHAAEQGKILNTLVQVNIGKEESKYGLMPEEVPEFLKAVSSFSHIRIRGLMTIHPFSVSKEESRRWFRQMAELRDNLSRAFPRIDLSELSMGMSNDFDVAIEEGATIVRIGTALFGPRD